MRKKTFCCLLTWKYHERQTLRSEMIELSQKVDKKKGLELKIIAVRGNRLNKKTNTNKIG